MVQNQFCPSNHLKEVAYMPMSERNLSMLFDFYEVTMRNGYFRNGFYKKHVVFDVL